MSFWNYLSKWIGKKKTRVKILCIGLDNSGKSTIINHFKDKKYRKGELAPTLGFAVETFQRSSIDFTAFDMSGQVSKVLSQHTCSDKCTAN